MNRNNNNNVLSKNQKKKLRKAENLLRQGGAPPKLNKASDNLPNGKLVTLSSSATAYARSLANPATGPLGAVPIHPAQLSKKFRVWAKGTFDVQTSNGIGYVAMSPDCMIANDRISVITSTAGGTNLTWFDWSTAFANFQSNSEYVASDVGVDENEFEYRIVSSELKVRYIGTELNRSGQLVGLMDSNHQPLFQRTLGSLDAEETSKRFPVDRTWTRVLYRPVDNDDFDFNAVPPPLISNTSDFYMGFAIQAPTGVSTPYEFEAHTCFEIFGKNIRAMTPSHVDPTGFGAVHAVSQLGSVLLPTKIPGNELEKTMVKNAAGYVADNTTTYSHVGRSSEKKKSDGDLDAVLGSAGGGIAAGIGLLGALSFLF